MWVYFQFKCYSFIKTVFDIDELHLKDILVKFTTYAAFHLYTLQG